MGSGKEVLEHDGLLTIFFFLLKCEYQINERLRFTRPIFVLPWQKRIKNKENTMGD